MYAAGRRGKQWRKVKPVHTLDLVVLAVEWGSGRRRGWLSNLHMGALDADGVPVMVGKTFKGMTDETARVADGALPRPRDAIATTTSCSSVPSRWSRSRSTARRRRPAIPAAWRCASRGCGATARQGPRRGRLARRRPGPPPPRPPLNTAAARTRLRSGRHRPRRVPSSAPLPNSTPYGPARAPSHSEFGEGGRPVRGGRRPDRGRRLRSRRPARRPRRRRLGWSTSAPEPGPPR